MVQGTDSPVLASIEIILNSDSGVQLRVQKSFSLGSTPGNFVSGNIRLWNPYSHSTPTCPRVKPSEESAKVSYITSTFRTTAVKFAFLFPPHPPVAQTPHKHLTGTDIRYPMCSRSTDTLEANLPEVGTTTYTENAKDALLKVFTVGYLLTVLKISSLCTHISFHIPYNIFI